MQPMQKIMRVFAQVIWNQKHRLELI